MKNWRTSLLGILAAVGLIVGNAAGARAADPKAAPLTFGNLLGPIAVAALGIVAKDSATSQN